VSCWWLKWYNTVVRFGKICRLPKSKQYHTSKPIPRLRASGRGSSGLDGGRPRRRRLAACAVPYTYQCSSSLPAISAVRRWFPRWRERKAAPTGYTVGRIAPPASILSPIKHILQPPLFLLTTVSLTPNVRLLFSGKPRWSTVQPRLQSLRGKRGIAAMSWWQQKYRYWCKILPGFSNSTVISSPH